MRMVSVMCSKGGDHEVDGVHWFPAYNYGVSQWIFFSFSHFLDTFLQLS